MSSKLSKTGNGFSIDILFHFHDCSVHAITDGGQRISIAVAFHSFDSALQATGYLDLAFQAVTEGADREQLKSHETATAAAYRHNSVFAD